MKQSAQKLKGYKSKPQLQEMHIYKNVPTKENTVTCYVISYSELFLPLWIGGEKEKVKVENLHYCAENDITLLQENPAQIQR